MDETDRRLLAAVQDGFPIASRPFRVLGEALAIPESAVIERLERLQSAGLIRKIGPILDMRRLGLSGVLVALKVSEQEAESFAKVINEYLEVSHNYLRPNESGYSLWFTISAREERIQEILEEIKSRTDKKMLILPTARIFKIGVKFDII